MASAILSYDISFGGWDTSYTETDISCLLDYITPRTMRTAAPLPQSVGTFLSCLSRSNIEQKLDRFSLAEYSYGWLMALEITIWFSAREDSIQ